MITLLAKAVIVSGKESEFERAFEEMASKVKASEPDTLLYKLTRSQSAANEFHIVEFYLSPDALKFHMSNPATGELMRGMGAFFAAAPEVNVLDDVAQA